MGVSFDLVMFDLDGTLVETACEICDAVNDTLMQFELPQVSLPQVTDWIGKGTRELLVLALSTSTQTSAEVVRASDSLGAMTVAFDAHYHQRCGTRSRLYPQVLHTLEVLHKRGVKLAVVTNKESRFTRKVLDAHQLTGWFNAVVSGDTFAAKKPHPEGIESCLKKFGVERQRALFVGDSSIDVAAARNAGVTVWVLPYGYNMGQPMDASMADRVIADCSELL